MPDVKVKGYSGTSFEYKDVNKVWLQSAESSDDDPVLVPYTYGELVEGTEIAPDFSAGDMQVTVPDGFLVKEAKILKPESLVPENVRKDVTIGGITGEFEGDTEAAEVELDMADGDMVIEPPEGKSFSAVTVKKPNTLVPENIVNGVTIGNVTGTADVPESVETTVNLDFSSGDMEVTPAEGQAFEKVSIPTPANLIPENIMEGVDIAGIIGSLAAGGGGAKIASGTISSTSSSDVQITHNLGVIPDLVLVIANTNTASSILVSYGASAAFRSKFYPLPNRAVVQTVFYISTDYSIEENRNGCAIRAATATTFYIRAMSGMKLQSGSVWLAIGGLT